MRKQYESPNQGTVAKISSGFVKIKEALKTNQPIEGSMYPPELQIVDSDSASFINDLVLPNYTNTSRDLSAWRISIQSVSEENCNSKKVQLFDVQVQRIDAVTDNKREWIVPRKDQDFHMLKAKLIEFHGESEISNSSLPSRKMPVEARKQKYEEFLKNLLQNPSLRGSDLLYTFLMTEQDFTLCLTTANPMVEDLGNMYQSVALKLRKEKGQHLDAFMKTFLVSTGCSSKGESVEVGDEVENLTVMDPPPPSPATYKNEVFGDNFGVPYKNVEESSCTSFSPSGMIESLFYLMQRIFKCPLHMQKLYVAICSIASEPVETFCRLYFDRKLKSALSQANLVYLIKLLEGVIFDHHHSPTEEETKTQKLEAFKAIQERIPDCFAKIFGKHFKAGAADILEILQNPLYNKQLVYNFLDIIVSEMYPDYDALEEVIK